MKLSKNLWLIFLITIFTQSLSFAGTTSEMKKFFMEGENKRNFNLAVKNGLIQQQKERIFLMCTKETPQETGLDCSCLKKVITDVSDEEFYYETQLATRQYREEVRVSREYGQEKYEQLRKKHDQRIGLNNRVEDTCGIDKKGK